MAEPKRTTSELRNRERARDDFVLEGYSDVEWEMVSVLWVDAESDGGSGWQDPEEMMDYARRPLPVIQTVGLLVYEDAEQIAVTDSKGPEEMGSVTKIPRQWVKQYHRLASVSSKQGGLAPPPEFTAEQRAG
ncbi:MAG: hypothetical protein P8L37_06075 [Phycisphaerales bacterium]|nr:hypothetical protein [Phycisphaerales bacterium]